LVTAAVFYSEAFCVQTSAKNAFFVQLKVFAVSLR